MLLQPIVENAIKHGLEPAVEGGTVRLGAREQAGAVEIVIADSGIGFTGATSNGIGLKNVRERIEKLFEGRGSLRDRGECTAGHARCDHIAEELKVKDWRGVWGDDGLRGAPVLEFSVVVSKQVRMRFFATLRMTRSTDWTNSQP